MKPTFLEPTPHLDRIADQIQHLLKSREFLHELDRLGALGTPPEGLYADLPTGDFLGFITQTLPKLHTLHAHLSSWWTTIIFHGSPNEDVRRLHDLIAEHLHGKG